MHRGIGFLDLHVKMYFQVINDFYSLEITIYILGC